MAAAYTSHPNDFLANYTFSTPYITIPVTDIGGVSDANAAAATGDIAEVLFGLLNAIYDEYKTRTAPTTWSLFRSTRVDESTNKQTVSFSAQFTTTIGSQTVDGSPTVDP
jgi:hypothetical protein